MWADCAVDRGLERGVGLVAAGEPFSSTPWPRHKGQEFRPVVNHWSKFSRSRCTLNGVHSQDIPHRCIGDERCDCTLITV